MWKQFSFIVTQQYENKVHELALAFFFPLVIEWVNNPSTASFQNDMTPQKLCKLWSVSPLDLAHLWDIKTLSTNCKNEAESACTSSASLPGHCGRTRTTSPLSGRLPLILRGKSSSAADFWSFFFLFFFFSPLFWSWIKFCWSPWESVFKVGHRRGCRVLSVHGCTCVLLLTSRSADRWARRSQLQCSCSERSSSGCWRGFSSDARPESLPCAGDP